MTDIDRLNASTAEARRRIENPTFAERVVDHVADLIQGEVGGPYQLSVDDVRRRAEDRINRMTNFEFLQVISDVASS